jgi:hypothetical protein
MCAPEPTRVALGYSNHDLSGERGQQQEANMTYRVYSGPKGTQSFSPIDKEHMLFKQVNALDEALSWAGHIEKTGRVALLIEGDDGTRLDRREIGAALGNGKREQVS